jgi:hypothetical protein
MMRKKLITIFAVTAMVVMMPTAKAVIVNVVPAGTAVWTSVNSLQLINVDYQVDQDLVSGLYYYQYQVEVPPVDDPIESLEIDAGANTLAVIATPLVGDILAPDNIVVGSLLTSSAGPLNVQWSLSPIDFGQESEVLAFTSPYAPTWGNGSATDDGNGPWSSQNPGSQLVPVPMLVPEPTTMLAGALLLLPFGAGTLRILRKDRAG